MPYRFQPALVANVQKMAKDLAERAARFLRQAGLATPGSRGLTIYPPIS